MGDGGEWRGMVGNGGERWGTVWGNEVGAAGDDRRTDGERTENGKTVEKGGKWQEPNERFERKAENETKRHLVENEDRVVGFNAKESFGTAVNECEREELKE